MKTSDLKKLALCLLICGATWAQAADSSAGEAKAQVCMACHGPGGASTQATYPILAGQPAQAISIALFEFREGKRKNELMSPMAANLTNKDLNDLAAYFSAQKAPAPASAMTEELASKGRALTVQYACIACHGAKLQGQQQMPRLAGQHRDYLRAQLLAFRTGQRQDLDGTMTSAAQSMAAQDVDVMADYLAALSAD
jgi:cytochrome c553